MKSFEKLIILLQSTYFSNVNSEDKAILSELMRILPTLDYVQLKNLLMPTADINNMIEINATFVAYKVTEEDKVTGKDKDKLVLQTELIKFLSTVNQATRSRLIEFLSRLIVLKHLLLQCVKELQDFVDEFNARFKKDNPDKTILSADKVVDLFVGKLFAYNKTVLKNVAASLDIISYFSGISEFSSYISNLYVACMFSIDNLNKNAPTLDKSTLVIKCMVDMEKLMQNLKAALEQYRDFHFDQIIPHLQLIYPKALQFYLELPQREVASAEIANIMRDFETKTAPYYGSPVLTFHLRKYTLLQEALKLLLHPTPHPEMMLIETIDLLNCKRAILLKKPPKTNEGWFSFFSSSSSMQYQEEKLLKEIYKLIDEYGNLAKTIQPAKSCS